MVCTSDFHRCLALSCALACAIGSRMSSLAGVQKHCPGIGTGATCTSCGFGCRGMPRKWYRNVTRGDRMAALLGVPGGNRASFDRAQLTRHGYFDYITCCTALRANGVVSPMLLGSTRLSSGSRLISHYSPTSTASRYRVCNLA